MGDFKKFGNVMIDLETLSTHNNAAIIEIGAVEFNKETGEIGETLNIIIDPSDWCRNDRHVDGETIKWWFKQSDEARKRFIEKQDGVLYSDLLEALYKLSYFIAGCDSPKITGNVVVWGNGIGMDISILENAYNYFNMLIPWKYWSVNDVRTIAALKPEIKKNYKWDSGVKHSAVADCIYQIGYVTETIKQLKQSDNSSLKEKMTNWLKEHISDYVVRKFNGGTPFQYVDDERLLNDFENIT